MKIRLAVTFLAVLFASIAVVAAPAAASSSDPQMGTWKLNEAKSKLMPGVPKITTVVFAPAGEKVKITTDGVDANKITTHTEWVGKFDGKDYPVTGDPSADTRAYKKIDARTVEFTGKTGGKVTMTVKIVVSADGKSRTATVQGRTPSGAPVVETQVFDKL